jgi:L-threonylcarbamoyladenylate synthase
MAAPPTIALGADLADAVARVSAALRAGGVVVVPTDTVYGLAALPGDAAAMARLFALKGRGPTVPVAVLCSDAEQALDLTAGPVAPEVRATAARWWPGPLTLVLPRRLGVHLHLGAPVTTVGVRVPDDALVRAVAAEVGPVAATSANRHGEPTPVSAAEVVAALGAGVDLLVDGGDLTAGASTVVDVTRVPWRVLREGPIPGPEVLALAPEA